MSTAPTQSFEFVCEWFERARLNAETIGKKEAAALWADGLEQLKHLQAQNADLVKALHHLKAVVELAVTKEDRTQYAYLETRRGSMVRTVEALQAADAALAKAGAA